MSVAQIKSLDQLNQTPLSLANELPISELVRELTDIIGRKFTAYVTSVTRPRVIESWIRGTAFPVPEAEERLRLTFAVSKIVRDRFDKQTAQAWLQGKNPDLQDQAALALIRQGTDLRRLESELISAAEIFAAK